MSRTKALALALVAFLSACSEAEGGRDRPPPLVKAEPATTMRFVERIEAVGTALANEQVTLAAPVTERIVRLNFDDGAYVTRGQTIAVLAQGQESAELSGAQARAREADQQLRRVQALRERGFATVSSLDTQAALAAQARAQAAGAEASIGDRVIRAPFSGWVSLRTISPGAVVSAGTEIATISDVSSVKLDFPVPETVLSALQPGLGIEAVSAAYPDQPFRGRIATIDPVIDPDSRAVTVRARLPNPDRRLKPGMLLTVAIETAQRMGLSVPELAVVGEGDKRFVYTIAPDGKAKRTEVRTGLRSGGRIEIVEGLKPGQQVVTEGVVKLSDGMKVRLAGAKNAVPAGQPKGKAR
ncbi:efflux RND transporter periplasmic adaptor subunit [Allosphingosinicella flava]|uniref:Efflux RND transporter periplasmic adaptor subunit n=1 Tax=Allosphingosinicella flava TaxID=2771430 RepID=A0A7T2LMI1_9SPHN|nr:efflux RND transporter periplasmic adaptor subunit [Sphingosinicella flava]QPQ55117.1 efflux RND transporter periplasmic adaptor subunit [Sphingosinicella flava]